LQNISIVNLRWVLIILSSILLGIWAAKETIALRNIILFVGTLLSIYYIILELCYGTLKKDSSFWRLLPLLLAGFSYVWVVTHYFFFSIDPGTQLNELRSTWLRAFLASIVGFGTGLALRNYPNRLNLLWLGLLVAFLILYYQYIPRALAQNKLLVPDYDHYLFHLKINTVLVGMILITGIQGALLDHLYIINCRLRNLKLWYLLYWLVGTALVMWSFVYIVNARNGIGLSTIMYCFWIVCIIIFFIRRKKHCLSLKSLLALLFINFGLFSLILYFAFLQTTVNQGWHTLFSDVKLAVQIDKYPNWQNLDKMGYPKHGDGEAVSNNTYERVAWATAGARAVMSYPKGVGVLAYPFAKHPHVATEIELSSSNQGIATHSGWVELGLAFGIPMLSLIFSALLTIFIQAARHSHPARMTVLGFTFLIFFLYSVGEVAVQHGIEILYYFLALLPALLLIKPKNLVDGSL